MSRNQNDVRRSFARALVALALASLFPLMTGCAFVAQVTRVKGSVLQVNELALDRWRKQPRQRRTLAGFNLELPRVPDATAAIELVPHEGPLGPS